MSSTGSEDTGTDWRLLNLPRPLERLEKTSTQRMFVDQFPVIKNALRDLCFHLFASLLTSKRRGRRSFPHSVDNSNESQKDEKFSNRREWKFTSWPLWAPLEGPLCPPQEPCAFLPCTFPPHSGSRTKLRRECFARWSLHCGWSRMWDLVIR